MQNYFSILCLLIMLLKSIAGIPTADIMKNYIGLIEVDTCKYNTSQISIMFNYYKKDYDYPLQITKIVDNKLQTYKVKLASNYVSRPPALIGSLVNFWFINSKKYLPEEEFFDFVVKRGDEWRPFLFFFYSDYVQLLAIDDVTKKRVVLVLVIDSFILEGFWERLISSSPKDNEPFGNELELQCKRLEVWTPKKQIIYLPHGTALLIQNKENDLMCNSAYYLPQKLRVTFINYLDFSYCKGTINLFKFNYTKDKCYYYAFNTDLNKIYFAKSFAVLQNNAPNFRNPKFISDSFQTFLYVNHIFIISGDWVFYFRFLDMDHKAWNNLKDRDIIATELSVMHIGQFYRCEPGGQQKQRTFTKGDYYYVKNKVIKKKEENEKPESKNSERTTKTITMNQGSNESINSAAKNAKKHLEESNLAEKNNEEDEEKKNKYIRYFGLAAIVVMVILIGIGLIIFCKSKNLPKIQPHTLPSIDSRSRLSVASSQGRHHSGSRLSNASSLGRHHSGSRLSAASFYGKQNSRSRLSNVHSLERPHSGNRLSAASFQSKHHSGSRLSAVSSLKKQQLGGRSSATSFLGNRLLGDRSSATSFLGNRLLGDRSSATSTCLWDNQSFKHS